MHRTTDSSENHTPTENRQRDELLVRNILDTAMDGIISMDSQHRVILFNPAAEAIFGFRAEQVLGRAIDVLIPSRFRLQHHNDVAKFGQGDIQQRRMGQQRTVMALHASGEEFPIESSISQTTVDGEKIYTVIVRDVTEAVRYRQQIEQQSQMLDQVSDAVIVVDLEGRITYWNQAATRQFGWTSAEALGQNANDLLNRGDQNLPAEMQCGGSQGGVWAGELQKTTRSGNRITVEHRRSALRDKDGNVIGCLWIDIDITKRKKWEQASRRSQRLESIGTLAGGIAHDLNNVLTPILMGARMLSSGRAPANPQGLLDTMTASAERGSNLVKQLLAFAGGIRGERSPVAMDVLLAETRLMLEHTLPMSIRFESRVIDGCPLVLGDETELSQVLVNLCINARDAMPDGGSITIEVTSIVLNGNASQLNPEAHPGPYVLLKVTDTGCGMTPDVIDRIFDPFYTTKEVGKGTGLGLATVQGIVKSHDGFISVYSEPGQGTSFSVYLPATQSTLLTPVVRIDHDDESGHGQTILLIDDEAHILQMTALALEHAGYQVITANDGFSGISLFKQFKPKIRAVLLDMMMPGLDGLQTLDQLRQIDTNVVVVACSGLRTSQREAEALERGANAFLPKPYSDDQLAHTLSLLLKTRDRPTLR
ncbi:MAG: PAS domain S-box protein [Planctomycetes bacterium]|nr:PAS domain S-box protein [Planctomycetota bacterium]